MPSNIGIKIANGEFYPLVEENSLIKKRLVLTTVHDNQPSVQIDLYRSNVKNMSNGQYIGSLVIENIKPKPKGEPSIEMVISSNKDGEIVADAVDLELGANGEHHVLTVSLRSLDETARDVEIQDFELESNDEPPSSLYNKASKVREEKQRSILPWIIIILLLLILGLAAWIFFFGGKDIICSLTGGNKTDTAQTQPIQSDVAPSEPARQEPAPQEPVAQPEPAPQPEPVRPAEPAPVIAAPAEPPAPRQGNARVRPSAPVASFNVPAVIPREGVNYRIRWGDTLWDISAAFYRDPWLYPRIARHNNIRNPNHIISGRTINIPPRN